MAHVVCVILLEFALFCISGPVFLASETDAKVCCLNLFRFSTSRSRLRTYYMQYTYVRMLSEPNEGAEKLVSFSNCAKQNPSLSLTTHIFTTFFSRFHKPAKEQGSFS